MKLIQSRRLSISREGFTIVETLITMAIAGLMLALIIMAIPALIRNGRNNQRKQDAAAILQAVSHYELNNSGSMPSACSFTCTSGGNFLDPANSVAKLTYYDPSGIILTNGSAGSPSNWGPFSELDKIRIYNYQKCDPNTRGQGTFSGAGYNDVVALYTIETLSGTSPQCLEL